MAMKAKRGGEIEEDFALYNYVLTAESCRLGNVSFKQAELGSDYGFLILFSIADP